MSEIEKMYENAGINLGCCKYAKYDYEGEEGIWYYCTKEGKECWTYPNGDADCVEKGYPTFTAEKQINLILCLSKRGIKFNCHSISSGYLLSKSKRKTSMRAGYKANNFPDLLAQHINYIWQDLTSEEKQQVKGILE